MRSVLSSMVLLSKFGQFLSENFHNVTFGSVTSDKIGVNAVFTTPISQIVFTVPDDSDILPSVTYHMNDEFSEFYSDGARFKGEPSDAFRGIVHMLQSWLCVNQF